MIEEIKKVWTCEHCGYVAVTEEDKERHEKYCYTRWQCFLSRKIGDDVEAKQNEHGFWDVFTKKPIRTWRFCCVRKEPADCNKLRYFQPEITDRMWNYCNEASCWIPSNSEANKERAKEVLKEAVKNKFRSFLTDLEQDLIDIEEH